MRPAVEAGRPGGLAVGNAFGLEVLRPDKPMARWKRIAADATAEPEAS